MAINPHPTGLETEGLDPVLAYTMNWSAEYAVPCVPPAAGAVLRLLAAASRARTAVEIGTGLGVSGLWLLAGLASGSVLTSIDTDTDLQAMARQAYSAAGHGAGRYRLLTGRAEVLLARLSDAGYDLMFVDIDEDRRGCIEAAARLLRPDGLLVVHRPLPEDHARLLAPQWSSAWLGPELLAATAKDHAQTAAATTS
jgi:predicted O-methyltransferase YrrM